VHGTLAWALDEILVIKVERSTLAILASKLERDFLTWIASHQEILMIRSCKGEYLS
jgi:hypothetical protein